MSITHFLEEISLGIENLLLHKTRSFLTMLGVVFGVGSVMAMLAVGEGASKEALDAIQKLGSHNILINAQKPVEDSGNNTQRSLMSVYGLLYEDYERLRESVDSIDKVVPVKVIRRRGRLGEKDLELRVVGTTSGWFEMVKRPLLAGRTLLPSDDEQQRSAVVLTEFGARKLLAGEGSIGQDLNIGGNVFSIVGIVESIGGVAGDIQLPDQQVDAYIPLAMARSYFGDIFVERTSGSHTREMVELHQILVEVISLEEVEKTSFAIEAMFRRSHPKHDYTIHVPLTLLQQAEQSKRTFNIVLGSIAGISLLVGGVGIMNIMLAVVTERTREIGVRRAIGAKRRQIIGQFLIETTVLSVLGGIVGIGLGALIPYLVTTFSGMPTVITPWSVALPLCISVLIGLVFGLYPAIRAAGVDPIVALRHD